MQEMITSRRQSPLTSSVEQENSTDENSGYTQKNISLHALQARAFLDASEDIQIDQAIIDDILAGIDNADDRALVTRYLGSDDDDGTSEITDDDADDEVDLSALYANDMDPDQPPRWTKQEVRHMHTFLKERGMLTWMIEYVILRENHIPDLLLAFGINLCKELCDKRMETMMYFLKVAVSRELRLRDRLPQYNTIADAISLIESSKRILILTGAGISVSCGIPDFRSRDGVYAMLKDGGDFQLDDPQQIACLPCHYYSHGSDEECLQHLSSFASQIYPTNFTPSPCHRFIKLVEDKGKLLRNYTQNIDTLETAAGVRSVLQCHGSFATATCLQCRRRVPGKEIEADILRGKVPLCSVCNAPGASGSSQNKKGRRKGRKKSSHKWDSDESDDSDQSEFPPGIMKPDITFFGEKLSDEFDRLLKTDRDKVDLLLVIGTSLKVSPVADILCHLPHSVPQILINKTPIRHVNPDIVLLGNADDIVQYLCQQMAWVLPPAPQPSTARLYPSRGNTKRLSSEALDIQEPRRVGESHVWLFQGAEGGKWVQDIEQHQASVVRNQNPPQSIEAAFLCGNTITTDDRQRKRARTD